MDHYPGYEKMAIKQSESECQLWSSLTGALYWINVVSFNNTTKNTPLFSSLIPFSYCLIARIHCHPMIQKTLLLNYHSVLWVSISGKYIFGLCFCHVAPFIEHVSFKEKTKQKKNNSSKKSGYDFLTLSSAAGSDNTTFNGNTCVKNNQDGSGAVEKNRIRLHLTETEIELH